MNPIKTIVLCGGRLALPTVKDLLLNQLLAAVIIPSSCPDMLEEVKAGLAGSGIPVIEVNKQSFASETIKAIEQYQANVGIVIAFGYKIPSSVYSLPQHGFYNVHPGPLPTYRGADPIFQQIRNREKHAGATIHLLDDGFDTGDIVMKEMIRLDPADTHGTLTTKLAALSSKLVMALIKLMLLELAPPRKRQDESKANYFKKQTAQDVTINWQVMDATLIVAVINASNPWNKGAITKINDTIIRLLIATSAKDEHFAYQHLLPGTIISNNANGMQVATINNELLNINIISCDGGFLQAERLSTFGILPGHRFESVVI